MNYKVVMPDKSEITFQEKESAIKSAKENSSKQKKVVSVFVQEGDEWEQIALVYPTGFVQEGAGGFGFFKKLPVGRTR